MLKKQKWSFFLPPDWPEDIVHDLFREQINRAYLNSLNEEILSLSDIKDAMYNDYNLQCTILNIRRDKDFRLGFYYIPSLDEVINEYGVSDQNMIDFAETFNHMIKHNGSLQISNEKYDNRFMNDLIAFLHQNEVCFVQKDLEPLFTKYSLENFRQAKTSETLHHFCITEVAT